jgi:hypothetical protein
MIPLFSLRALVITNALVPLIYALFQRKFSRQLADPVYKVDYYSKELPHPIEDTSKYEFE